MIVSVTIELEKLAALLVVVFGSNRLGIGSIDGYCPQHIGKRVPIDGADRNRLCKLSSQYSFVHHNWLCTVSINRHCQKQYISEAIDRQLQH